MDRVIVCLSCARAEPRQSNAVFCFECAIQRTVEQSRAIGAVSRAVARNEMAPASELACTDCGEPAAAYDHRDYTRQLDVEPVCASCNVARGPALDSQMRDMPGSLSLIDLHGSSICLREPLNATQRIGAML